VSLKENLKINQFIALTLANYGFACYLVGVEYSFHLSVLFIGFFVNQVFLLLGVNNILNSGEKKRTKRTMFMFVGKFFVLVGVIVYALQNMNEKALYSLLFYIFQLIILIISIKRIPKKIKELSL
jgi:hypothetical protein